jgi:hypothetical protein
VDVVILAILAGYSDNFAEVDTSTPLAIMAALMAALVVNNPEM